MVGRSREAPGAGSWVFRPPGSSPILAGHMRRATALAWLSLLLAGCGQSGCEEYAGWATYDDPSGQFSIRYLEPPWNICTGTEFEADCHECPAHLLGAEACGGADRYVLFWIEPVLLDPEFLLIPSYKLEISWVPGEMNPLDLAVAEQAVVAAAGMEISGEASAVGFQDGRLGAEVAYRGPVYIMVAEDPVARPDEREYRVVFTSGGGFSYRLQLDSAIDADAPEVGDMLGSFSINDGAGGG